MPFPRSREGTPSPTYVGEYPSLPREWGGGSRFRRTPPSLHKGANAREEKGKTMSKRLEWAENEIDEIMDELDDFTRTAMEETNAVDVVMYLAGDDDDPGPLYILKDEHHLGFEIVDKIDVRDEIIEFEKAVGLR